MKKIKTRGGGNWKCLWEKNFHGNFWFQWKNLKISERNWKLHYDLFQFIHPPRLFKIFFSWELNDKHKIFDRFPPWSRFSSSHRKTLNRNSTIVRLFGHSTPFLMLAPLMKSRCMWRREKLSDFSKQNCGILAKQSWSRFNFCSRSANFVDRFSHKEFHNFPSRWNVVVNHVAGRLNRDFVCLMSSETASTF